MKSLKAILRSLFFLTNLTVVILLIASAYSDYISPEKYLLMSYLGLAFPIFCTINLLYLIWWIAMHRWKYAVTCLCSFIICWGPITRYFPFNRPTEVPTENTLKVLTYNVMNFAGKRHTAESPNKIIEYIINSDADIVCLQEYAVAKSAKELDAPTLNKALKMYPYRSITELNSTKYRTSGLAVFSKYPLSKSRKIKYESQYNGSSIHEVDVKGKKITLINNHLESFHLTHEDKSQYGNLIKSMDSEVLGGVRGTFQQKLGPAYRKRAQQARLVANDIQNTQGEYIIACGDFNDTPISYAHKTIQGYLTDAFEKSGMGMGVTYNQNLFRFRIDHILHSKNMKSYNCTIDKVKFSDHYPVWCYLELN